MRIDSGTVVAAQYLEAYILAPSDDMPLLSRLVAKSEAAGHDVSSLGALQRLLRARRPSDDDAAVAAFVDQLNAKTLSGDAAMTACEWQARRAAEAETRRAAEETRRAAAAAETRRRAEQEAKAECAMAEAVARGAAAARRAEEAAAAADTDTESSVASSEASVTSSEEGASSAEEDANATAEAARERHALEAEYAWNDFWARQPASLRGDFKAVPGGYRVVLRGAGTKRLRLEATDEGDLRVEGVLLPTPATQATLLRAAKARGPVTERLLARLANNSYGRVDEVIRMPADAALAKATRDDRDDSVVILVPRKPPRRRAVGRRLVREASYPPVVCGPGAGYYW